MTDPAAPGPLLPASLAFVAGFVDTCGFVALYGLFSAHVTGNFVLLGASLIQPHAGVIAKLLALPVFMIAVALTRLYLIRSPSLAIRGVLLAEGVFLVLFLVAGIRLPLVIDADAPLAVIAGMSAVVAMGIQNAASRTVFATLSPTTVMTGNVTQVVLDTVDLLAGPTEETRTAASGRLRKFGPPVIAFGAGAAAGAVGYGFGGYWCLLLPIALIVVLLARSAR